MPPRVYPVALLSCLLVSVLFTGCAGSAPSNSSRLPATETVSITANPVSVASGGTAALTVTAANATQVTVSGTDGSMYTLQPSGGTQSVSPTVTTTYTATATGSEGKTTATVTIVVVTQNTPPTTSILASPASIASGSSATLIVTATSATQVTVTGTDGSTYTLQPSGGTQSVIPTVTTTYTATATGAGGNTSVTATVTVIPPVAPTVSITANPTSIPSGNSSVLTVTATNATQVTVTGTDGSSYPMQSTGGTLIVSPSGTTTYTASATGLGGNKSTSVTVTIIPQSIPIVTIAASPATIVAGNSSTLTVTATNATQVTLAGTDGSSYTLQPSGGTQSVSPSATTTYKATATGSGANASNSATVTVGAAGSVQSIDHVVFMLQENHTFDNYFGMMNPYRVKNRWNIGDDGKTYTVDGIDDKLTTISNTDDEGDTYKLFKFTSTCIDDESSAWLESYGDINRYNFIASRPINMDGFVHNAEGYANSCAIGGGCSGNFTDTTGQRAMGYYDEKLLNYYYYMASQFAISDRWFSPVSSKSISNRIATFTGGTTQGLVRDPSNEDHFAQLSIPTIFENLDHANVTWRIYYTVTQGFCMAGGPCSGSPYPATDFSELSYSFQYLHTKPSGGSCAAPTQPSSVVGDTSNSFCIDTAHIAPLSTYFNDLTNGTLPSFTFIEAGYGSNDEHPGSGQSILEGQAQVASIVNAFMSSPEWKDSVFFLSYDEGGGPYDHVPPVPGSSNNNTDPSLLASTTIPDISTIAVNPDTYNPCVPAIPGTPTLHCDLASTDPGGHAGDAAAVNGFAAQLGFRVPNIIISPFTRRHYVSHTPMDHTALIKFVENRFIPNYTPLTNRDAAQSDLLEFFDFNNIPWATPPTPPTPASLTDPSSPGYNTCTPTSMGP